MREKWPLAQSTGRGVHHSAVGGCTGGDLEGQPPSFHHPEPSMPRRSPDQCRNPAGESCLALDVEPPSQLPGLKIKDTRRTVTYTSAIFSHGDSKRAATGFKIHPSKVK